MSSEKKFFISFAVLILIIYGQSLFGTFVFDDRGILEHSQLLSGLDNIFQVVMHPYWTVEAGLYRPTTLLSYLFNNVFLGEGAFGFHLVNLALYFGIVSSIFVLLRKLFKHTWLAWLSALVFLVLPIHTEVVANITGRSELLALFFSLLTLIEFTKESPKSWKIALWTLLAIGAKETAVSVVPLAVIVLWIKAGGFEWCVIRDQWKHVASLFLGAAIYFVLRLVVLGPEHFLGVETSIIENPLLFSDSLGRVATALSILWMYVSKTFYPVNLCSDYSYNQIPIVDGFWHLGTILGSLVLLGSVVSFFLFWSRQKFLSLASAIFLLSFLPISNLLFPIGTIAGERLFFFPSLGMAMVLAWLLAKIKIKWLPVLMLVPLSLVAFNRQSVWLTEERLFLNAVECSPQSVLSRSNAGATYYLGGDLEKAEEQLDISRAIKPVYSKGLNNLGLVYWKQGRYREAENMYHEALKQKYPYPGAFENIILLYASERDEVSALRWLRIMYPNVDDSVLRNLF